MEASSINTLSNFLTKKLVSVMPHPPDLPDMAPAVYFMFLKLKMALKGTHFHSVEKIKARVTAVLKTIPKVESLTSF